MGRRGSPFLVLPALCLVLLGALSQVAVAREMNRIVLRVNDRIATLHDYESMKEERLIALSRAQLPQAELQRRVAGLGVSVMKELFDEMLILSRADQLSMRVEESDVQRSMEQTKRGFGITSEEEFEQALATNGLTRETFRAQIEKGLLLRQVMGREVYSQIEIQEEDLRRYYQENEDEFRVAARRQLREVVVLEAGRSTEDLAALAEEVRNGMLSESPDTVIAASEADGVSTGWIDLGWVEIGDLDPELEAALVDLQPGDISRPTPARGGLHVIQVVDARPEEVRPFREVASDIEARMSDERFQKALEVYMKDLETKAYIESDPPPEAAGFRSGRAAERAPMEGLEAALQDASAAQEVVEATPVEDEEAPPPPQR